MISIRVIKPFYLLWLFLLLPLPVLAKTILVWGDSLSAAYNIPVEKSWVSLLQTRLDTRPGENWKVVNGSVSGETTTGGLSRLPTALDTHKPEILIIELGSNDGLRGQPLVLLRRNLLKMIELGRASGARVLLIGNRIPPNYGSRYTQGFITVYEDLANREEVPLVPFFMQGIATDDTLLQRDRMHPTAQAQARLLENIWPTLEPLLEE